MRTTAARLVAHGQLLEVGEVELTEPAPDEVVLDMAFAGVNPVDRYGALGRVAPDGPLPRTLGSEGVGYLDGRPYAVRGQGLGARRDGLWARHAVAPLSALVPLPDGADPAKAAAMGVAGLTAWRIVTELGEVSAGDRVLVLGAAGGVGHIALTVAARRGAEVWAQVGSEDKAAFVRQLGAAGVIVGGAEAVAAEAGGFRPQVVLDPLGGPFTGAAVQVLAERGRVVIFGTSADAEGTVPLQQLYRKGSRILGYGGLIEPDEVLQAGLGEALLALAEGRLDVVVDAVLPLAEVNDAFERLAGRRVLGKVLLDLRS